MKKTTIGAFLALALVGAMVTAQSAVFYRQFVAPTS